MTVNFLINNNIYFLVLDASILNRISATCTKILTASRYSPRLSLIGSNLPGVLALT